MILSGSESLSMTSEHYQEVRSTGDNGASNRSHSISTNRGLTEGQDGRLAWMTMPDPRLMDERRDRWTARIYGYFRSTNGGSERKGD